MDNENATTTRERFLKIYANLPLSVRNEIVYVTEDKKPLTWNAAYIEILNETQLSPSILAYLDRLGII